MDMIAILPSDWRAAVLLGRIETARLLKRRSQKAAHALGSKGATSALPRTARDLSRLKAVAALSHRQIDVNPEQRFPIWMAG